MSNPNVVEKPYNGNRSIEVMVNGNTVSYVFSSPPLVLVDKEVIEDRTLQQVVLEELTQSNSESQLPLNAVEHYNNHLRRETVREEKRNKYRGNDKSLEELAERLKRAVNLSTPVQVTVFDRLIPRISSAYGGSSRIEQEGSHRYVTINGTRICWSPGQKKKDNSMSTGIIDKVLELIEKTTGIPQDYLNLYVRGSGNAYDKFAKVFEQRYLNDVKQK